MSTIHLFAAFFLGVASLSATACAEERSSLQCEGEVVRYNCPTSVAFSAEPDAPGFTKSSVVLGPSSSAQICFHHPAAPDGSMVVPKSISCMHKVIGGEGHGCPTFKCTFNTSCGDVLFDGGTQRKIGNSWEYCVTIHTGPNTTNAQVSGRI